jgi:hypothetical protein
MDENQFKKTVAAASSLVGEATENLEYQRGMAELIARAFPHRPGETPALALDVLEAMHPGIPRDLLEKLHYGSHQESQVAACDIRGLEGAMEGKDEEPEVFVTLRYISKAGAWDKFCEWSGTSVCALNEGADQYEQVSIPLSKAKEWGVA